MPTYAAKRSTNRRGSKATYDPMRRIAKMAADQAWEKAMAVAEIMAPDNPMDTEELDDETQWLILQELAINLSPEFWDEADAIDDYYALLGKFAPGVERDYLKPIAQAKRASNQKLPDVSITPENPEYEHMVARMKRS